jgi:nitrogen fixation/metabolism regulation signal transduction histidine kinase
MKEIDGQLTRSVSGMRDRIKEVMHSSRSFILLLSLAAILLSALFTLFFVLSTIRRPMALIGQGIESIREGNLDTRIRLDRHDEWGVIEGALNRMAADLKASYEELRRKNTDLEITHGALNDKVAELVTEVEARTRAERKLARHQEHLEEMVLARTAELEAAQKELVQRERLSVLGRLTATVSHELRNPLGVIRSSVFYLARRLGREDEKITKHLDRIEQQVTLSDAIVGDLLEYTRKSLCEMTEVDLNAWLAEVMEQFAPAEGVGLLQEFEEGLPLLRFDREKMRRVVVNLVENALHAVSGRAEQGRDDEYHPRVRLVTAADGEGVRMVVADNGGGMDGATAERAFEPLFTTRARGTGLGLAIVRKVVEEHGGIVTLASELQRGTEVGVWLPREPPEAAA